MNRGEILLVVVTHIAFGLLRKRSKISKRIRSAAEVVGGQASSSAAVVHLTLALCLGPQALKFTVKSKRIDRDQLTLLQCRR